MAKYKSISFDEIESLATRAAGGDSSALAELGRLNSKYGRAANQRARELEKRGLSTTAAYERAQAMSGKDRPRFSQAKTGSAEQLVRNLEETTKFLNYQTSTVSGEMQRRENIIRGLEMVGYNVGKNKKAFLDFLDSNAWAEFKSVFGSGDAMRQISDSISAGANIEDLMDAYESFQAGEGNADDLLQVWDGWYSEADQGGNS